MQIRYVNKYNYGYIHHSTWIPTLHAKAHSLRYLLSAGSGLTKTQREYNCHTQQNFCKWILAPPKLSFWINNDVALLMELHFLELLSESTHRPFCMISRLTHLCPSR